MKITRGSAEQLLAELVGATLGDPRRNARAARIVEKLTDDPSRSLPAALGKDADVQGCYRFVNNPEVCFDALHAGHAAATGQRARAAGEVLVLHDTTHCSFEHLDPEELGYLPTGKAGFHLHLGLVLDGSTWKRPLGVIHAETIHRVEKPRPNKSKQRKRPKKSGTATAKQPHKEFDRWWRGIQAAHESLAGVRATHVADRESDSYALMAQTLTLGHDFIFRSRVDRRSRRADQPGGDWSTVREIARCCDGVLEREVPLSRRRASGAPAQTKVHPPRKTRLARLRFAATRVVIPRPQYLADPIPRTLTLSLVHVAEVDPPPDEPAVEWLLYTNRSVDTPAQVAKVVDDYRARWTIEEFNAALKTGCAYEAREFESRHALLNMLAISLPIACEVLWLRSRARSTPEAPASDVLSPVQLDVLRHFSPKLSPKPTAQDALLAVAALGGHLRRNGPPGWKLLLDGMGVLQAHTAGWEAALAHVRRRKKL
jgi:hypothetical protein